MATRQPSLSYCAETVRRFDGDRFLICLLAPVDRREALFTLHAFNLEIAKTREVVTEPLLGRMRLQWWRDAVAAAYAGEAHVTSTPHEVLTPLAEAIAHHRLSRRHLDMLIDAREADLEPEGPATMPCLVHYAEATAAPLVHLSLECLDACDPSAVDAARHAAIAFALANLLRAVPFHLARGRLTLPADRLRAHGVRIGRLFDFPGPDPGIAATAAEVAATAQSHLERSRSLQPQVGKRARPALRVATIAHLHLQRLARAGHDPWHPTVAAPHPHRAVALLWAEIRGRY